MSKPYEGSGSIEYLGYEIISLISRGYKEDVDEIISKMEEGMHIPQKQSTRSA